MKSNEFLTVAQSLLKEVTEGAWRSAVSRAYYAAFHCARECMEELGFVVPRGERAHGYLWLRLSNCADIEVRQTGTGLNSLRQDRNQSDYDLHRSISQPNAARCVKAAEQIILLLTSMGIATRSAVTEAMKTYESHVLKETSWRS